jgi:uncharacterized protein (TIGR02118 family)
MSIIITVLYPNTPGSRFDFDYFLKSHKPLIESRWRGKGMTSFKALKAKGTADPATPAPYQAIAVIGFESLAALQSAAKDTAAALASDIANFTDVTPIVQLNDDLG